MMKKIVVDTDVLVALFRQDDVQHEKAKHILKKLHEDNCQFIILNLVVQEAATVLSNRVGMELARLFYERVEEFVDQVIVLNEEIEEKAWDIFLQQTKKKTSFIDCAVLATWEITKSEKIFAFDTFYPDKTRIV